MNRREIKRKLFCQVVVCTVLTTVAVAGGKIENEHFAGLYGKVASYTSHQVTLSEMQAIGAEFAGQVRGAPSKMVSAITAANEASRYGHPIDEKSESEVLQVHAAAGGKVLTSGWDKELGLFVKIRHEDAITVYGNLSDIIVVESERVQRGEIIGSYKKDSEKEFFYELQENL